MTSQIERLPVELFELVAASLELLSCKNLRLTSQRLRFLIHPLFVECAFSRLKTTLGSPSLGRLVNVSRCENLRGAVKVLQIQLLTSCVEEVLTSNWIVHRMHYISHFWRRHPCVDLLSYKPSYA